MLLLWRRGCHIRGHVVRARGGKHHTRCRRCRHVRRHRGGHCTTASATLTLVKVLLRRGRRRPNWRCAGGATRTAANGTKVGGCHVKVASIAGSLSCIYHRLRAGGGQGARRPTCSAAYANPGRCHGCKVGLRGLSLSPHAGLSFLAEHIVEGREGLRDAHCGCRRACRGRRSGCR